MILTVKNLLYGLHFMNREMSAKKLWLTIKCCVISIIFGSFSCLDIVPDSTLPEYWISNKIGNTDRDGMSKVKKEPNICLNSTE